MCCILVVAIIAYLVAAVHLTGAYTFHDSGLLFRTVSLAPGDYTLTLDSSDEVKVTVYTQSKEEKIAETSTTLYSGAPEEAAFTVTGEEEVHFRFDAASGTELRSVTLSDGTSLKLNYWLLPSFVADRLQGSLLSDYSTWMRLQYDIDGLKLFMQRPLLGYGLGSTEAWLGSVQPYYYESAYVHNHLIQSADDMGIVGLLSLLALMGGTAWLLLRRLRKESDALGGDAAGLLGHDESPWAYGAEFLNSCLSMCRIFPVGGGHCPVWNTSFEKRAGPFRALHCSGTVCGVLGDVRCIGME